MYKAFIFGLTGGLSGLAGALYVAANGLAGPDYFTTTFSIEVVIWVAVGGRGTLLGAIIGAIWVGFFQSYVSAALPNHWLFVEGALFIGVVLFLPRGIVNLGGLGALLGALLGAVLVVPLRTEVCAGLSSFKANLICSSFLLVMVVLPRLITQDLPRLVRWIRGQGSGVRGQESGVGSQESGVRGQESEIKNLEDAASSQQSMLTPDP
jgi:ABC-type branched-subunit amino acid transport system permease subunit